MSNDFKTWVKAATVRAVKTCAQTAAASMSTATVINAVDIKVVASTSILAAILSFITSIAGLPEIKKED